MYKRFSAEVWALCCTLIIGVTQAATVTWKSSTDGAFWVDKPAITTSAWDNDQTSYISADETQTDQEIQDWGGCVNERPWDGLMKLSAANRDSAVRAMFDTVEGILTCARCPIGMSDMAMGHYADDDSFTVDYTMSKFSIAEDQKYLIPWLKAAQKWNPHLKVWGSPWTQPPWMKTTNDFYGGSLKTDSQTRNAYVLYLEKWCQAFRAEGINVWCIHLQNEMQHNNPGWLVTHFEPADMRDFIKLQYAKFRQDDIPVETGLGTSVQDDNPPTLIPTVLNDTVANSYVSCVAVQYSTLNAQYCHSTWPLKIVWLSETPAEAAFAWSDGEANWTAMHDYLVNGVNSYNQWDIANIKNGVSNQGLKWGAPIQVDTASKTYTLTPIYWQIKHLSYFVKPGALRIKSTGNYSNHLAFRNRNGQNAVVVANITGSSATVAINLNGQKIKPTIPAHSFNTFSIAGTPIPDISPFNQIEAENYTAQSGTYVIPCSEGGKCLSYIHNNEWAYYYHLDFGTGTSSFQARVAGTVGGSIEIRLDSLTAAPVGTCAVASTGTATTWQTMSCDLTTPISGKHVLYLKFKGTGSANLFNLNWWKFVPGTSVEKTSTMAEEYGNTIKIATAFGKTQTLRLDFSQPVSRQNLKVGLFDLSGRLVALLFNGKPSCPHLTLQFNRSAIGPGVYVIKVLLDNKIALVKTVAL
jgi:glucosylceramidase